MGLKEKLQGDLTEAIRSRDELNSGTIRMLLAAIQVEEVAGKEARTLKDDEIIKVLSREAKKRREAADAYKDAGRADKAEQETKEGEVILKYLPEQLSEDEIKKIVSDAVAEAGATTPQQMGAVMKIVQPKVAGKADGGMVSSLVKAALGAN
jgi:uncharacterized protein YqeY